MIRANKKVFIFRQGNCTMNVLHPSLSKSFALSICSKDPTKNSALGYTAKCITSCNHDGSLEDDYCVPFFKLKFLIPTIRHIVCSPKPKIYGQSDFESSVPREIRSENIQFCGLKKETFISNGRKI